MPLPFDSELQRMTDAELDRLWAKRPRYPQTAGEMDWIRVAKERRYRKRQREWKAQRRGPSLRLS